MQYRITVKQQGVIIAKKTVSAVDALSAINIVELGYGEPPKVEQKVVELENGVKRHIMVVHNWHGYSFVAQRIRPT